MTVNGKDSVESSGSVDSRGRKKEVVIAPIFAEHCKEKLEELKINPLKLATKLELQYDTVRKVCKGITFAGPKILPAVCGALGLDVDDMIKIVTEEKMAHKGFVPGDILDMIDPLLADINDLFIGLSRKDKKYILDEIRRLSEHGSKE